MAPRNIKLTISYDGSGYHGWQTQPGYKTIQQTLTEAIAALVGGEVRIHGASRTDAGVSALAQAAVVEIDSPIPTENLAKAITDRLPPEIAVTEAQDIPLGFDITSEAKSKLYRYTIFTGPVRPVLQINHCWHLPKKLDIDAMTEAAGLLVGKKDFKSFASADDQRENSVRTIFACSVKAENDWIYIDTAGDGFLYNMVRNIVGTLTEVGRGRWEPQKMTEIISACDRSTAGPIAPPQGLCLMWIKY
jgi:tRNA pseudouridine38-40 synthase